MSLASRRGFRRAAMIAIGVAGLVLSMAIPSLAVHDLDFQLDGNTEDDSADPNYDWETFFKGPGDINEKVTLPNASFPGFTASGAKVDYALPDHSTYATGSKDTLSISPGWQCKKSNNVGDKVDILNAYSVVYEVGGDTILYFGAEISAPNGDANIGVWFLQDGNVGCDASGGGNVGFTGNHMDGDLFVVSAFTNGGSTANISAYEWEGGDNGALNETPAATGKLCGSGGVDTACAITNSGAVNTPWNSPDKNGGDLDPREFFEGAVNLTDAGLTTSCFARFVANTRSSQSLTATIFDFAAGSLETCRPSTVLTKTASAQVTYSYTEANDGNAELTSVGVTDDKCSPVVQVLGGNGKNVGDTDADGKLDPGEVWQFRCTTTLNGPIDQTNVAFGVGTDAAGRLVTGNPSCTPSSTRFCDSDERDSVRIQITHN